MSQLVDGSIEWITLNRLTESNPLEVGEITTVHIIAEQPTFCWWIPYTLRKHDHLMYAVKSRIVKVSHKYGVEFPMSVNHAYNLDWFNKKSIWRDAINKEMRNLKVAFDILNKGSEAPASYRKASNHMVFNVHMTLGRKARRVRDEHITHEPEHSICIGAVSRESILFVLTCDYLYGLSAFGADIQNAHLQAPTSEKHYIIRGQEFGLENMGKQQ